MKRFFTYIAILLIALLGIMYVFDMLFTYVYNHGAYRNKVMWVREMSNVQTDYILIGSSRMNNHLDPIQIEKETGLKGLNLGINAFGSFESLLLLDEYLRLNKTKKIFLQVDSQYIESGPDPIGEKTWLPYIKEQHIYDKFETHGSVYRWYKHIPFYRYLKYESRIGFRNVITSASGKGFTYKKSKGFTPNSNVLKSEKEYVREKDIVAENESIKKMLALAKKHNSEVFFFTAPIYKFEGDLSPLETYLPNYKDFKDTITRRELFADQVHLNTTGAAIFTSIFSDYYFNQQRVETTMQPN